MKRLRQGNINTPQYFDEQFSGKQVDMENTLRQDRYLALLATHPRIESVIELGCGVSAFLPKAADIYPYVHGVDFAKDTIARLRIDYPHIVYDVGDATTTIYTKEQFDAVVSGELLEHMEVPALLVSEMARICKVGGIMILSTPHLEFDDPEHLWEFDENDLRLFFSAYGTPVVETIESERFPGRKYLIVWTIKEH